VSDVTTNEPELQADTLELINSELTARLVRQSGASAQIDTKAVLLVGYAVAASAFLATRHVQPVLAGIAYAAYASAAGFGIWAYAVGAYHDVPRPRQLLNEYAAKTKSDTLAALAATRVRAFEANAARQDRKAARWKMSLVTLMIGVVLMLASILVHTQSHGRPAGRAHHPAAVTTNAATTTGGRPGRSA
jgi:hypothetical protein